MSMPRCADDKTTLLVRMPNGLIHELIQQSKQVRIIKLRMNN